MFLFSGVCWFIVVCSVDFVLLVLIRVLKWMLCGLLLWLLMKCVWLVLKLIVCRWWWKCMVVLVCLVSFSSVMFRLWWWID